MWIVWSLTLVALRLIEQSRNDGVASGCAGRAKVPVGAHGSRRHDGTVPDVNAFENHRVDADNNVFADVNGGYLRRLVPHAGFKASCPVIVIRQNTARADSGIVIDLDAALHVKLDTAPDKNPIANANAGPGLPVPVEFEIDIGFEYTPASDLKLVRPGDYAFRDRGPGANACAKQL